MINICCKYATEYSVIFNSSKTKLIFCSATSAVYEPRIFIDGQRIQTINSVKHLGFPIGNVSDADVMTNAIKEFMSRVNMVKSHFNNLPHRVIYQLFKSYCMPLFGSALWNYTGRDINRFFVAWRKAIRYIMNIPRTTHCNLPHVLCNDIPVRDQLYHRFAKFLHSLVNSNNNITRLCAKLAMNGSRSILCNNITLISHHYSMSRYDLA